MLIDQDSKGLMTITDITRNDALLLKKAVKLLLPELEKEREKESRSWVTSSAYFDFHRKYNIAIAIDRCYTLIRAVNLFFPAGGKRPETVGEVDSQ